jgi:hypothetical protein
MSPILQALITLTVRILLRLLFLRQVPLTIRHNLPHVVNVILVVLARVFLGILFQDSNDLATRIVPDGLAAAVVLGPSGSNGFVATKPILEFFGRHIHEFVELSEIKVIIRSGHVVVNV